MNSISSSTTSARWDARLWGALIVLCGVVFLDALDVSMVGVALPSIRADLGLSTSELQWVVSGYVLAYGGLLLLGGRTADLLGRKRTLLIALGGFVARVGARRHRQDGTVLVAARVVKGIERGVHRPRGAVDHHDDLPGGPGPQPGAEHLHHRRRERLLARPRARRGADRAGLALHVPARRPGRAGAADRRPAARSRPTAA